MGDIIFRNPRIKFRSEEFGGIVKTEKGLYLLDDQTYCILRDFDVEQGEVIKDEPGDLILGLMEIGALIKIMEEEAKWVRKKVGLE